MSEFKLEEIFSNESVNVFGKVLRRALASKEFGGAEDYASLIELESIESKEELAEFLKKFLRRYHGYARKREKEGKYTFIPTDEDLIGLVKIVDNIADRKINGVKLIRAALISHALVKSSKEEQNIKEKGGGE